MIFETPLLPPNNCTRVSDDMNSNVTYASLLTPPTDDNSSPYLETLQSPSSYNAINSSFKNFTLDHNRILVEIPMSVDESSSDGFLLSSKPCLRILEQPIDKFRFRYKSEMTGTHGSLNGMNNDKSRKVTYPTVELLGFEHPAIVRCSIYQINTQDRDMMPHAHRLVKKSGNKEEVDDPHDIEVNSENSFTAVFKSMGIIHTAKKNIVGELVKKKTKLKKEQIARDEGRKRDLNTREEVEIKGLAEVESKSINLNVVCLRFDAYYSQHGILKQICEPVYSHGINNLKSALTGELKIVRMDHCTSPAKGGLEIFILVERVTKKNVKIRFFEVDESDSEIWEDYGKFSDLDVHHQYAIVFKTPPYKDKHITGPVKVFIELVRPSDNSKSEPKEFTYIPNSKEYRAGGKRPRMNDSYSSSGSLSSAEIPQTIEDVHLNTLMTLTSEELQRAAKNIDSGEFEILYRNNLAAYLEAFEDTNTNRPSMNKSVTVDAGIQNRGDNASEKSDATRVFSELKAFLTTKPKKTRVLEFLNSYFGTENKTNALHTFIKENMVMNANSLIVLLEKFTPHLLDIKSKYGETPLWLAVTINSVDIVTYLVRGGASIKIPYSDGNTVLHSSISNTTFSLDVFEALLASKELEQCIDMENNDGETPLALAIENRNIVAVKLLCRHGANINKTNKKNGFTPLRMAVEVQDVDIVRLILSHEDIDATIEDFNNVSPACAAMGNEKIYTLIAEHLKNNGCSVDIKEEITEEASDEEMDCTGVKEEQDNFEDLKTLYNGVHNFTESCLNTVSALLDKSGNYQHLADLLELDHLLRSDLIHPDCSSPSKVLLSYAEQTETIYNIRNFLENLDENEAVLVIDQMVKNWSS